MIKLLNLITRHYNKLAQWQNILCSRFTAKNVWTAYPYLYQNGTNWNESYTTTSVESYGNIIKIVIDCQRNSNFSTGNIDNLNMPTILTYPNNPSKFVASCYKTDDLEHAVQQSYKETIVKGLIQPDFRAFYCLSVINGGLKSISCTPEIGDQSYIATGTGLSVKVTYLQPSINSVQTADAYAYVNAFTVGDCFSANPYQ